MSANQFAHLRVRSDYSLSSGLCRVEKTAEFAEELGLSAVALTDINSMGGALEFQQNMRSHGIKAIIGCEVDVAVNRENEDRSNNFSRLILLAKNPQGYRNLCGIVSSANIAPRNSRTFSTCRRLAEHSNGIIAISTSPTENPDYPNTDIAKAYFADLLEIFGEGNLYLELVDHGLECEKTANLAQLRLANELNLNVVATNDVRFLKKEDADAYAVLRGIAKSKPAMYHPEPIDKHLPNSEYRLKNANEMAELFKELPEALSNTLEIAEKCELEIPTVFPPERYPVYEISSDISKKEYLRNLCVRNITNRYGKNDEVDGGTTVASSDVIDRLEYELGVIDRAGLNDYFLLLWDLARFAREQGITIGPGRGSSCGSITLFLLRVTEIDPLRHSLHFERFLNTERVSPPTVEFEVCEERRGELFEYLRGKYGTDKTAYIATYPTLRGKKLVMAISDAIGRDASEDFRRIRKRITDESPARSVNSFVERNPKLRELIDNESWAKNLYDYAIRLQGVKTGMEPHASGILIGNESLRKIIPIQKSDDGRVITQYTAEHCEQLGFLQLDILGLKALSEIQKTTFEVEKRFSDFDLEDIPLDDAKTLELFNKGDTEGIWNFSFSGIREICVEFGVESFEHLIALASVYRPGTLMLYPLMLEGKRDGFEPPYGIHELDRPLDETYGVILYQEQIMELIRNAAGMTLGEADILRRMLGKKKIDLIEHERPRFFERCAENGLEAKIVERLWNDLIKTAGIAFNKAHASASALTAYRMAYLKAHFTNETALEKGAFQ